MDRITAINILEDRKFEAINEGYKAFSEALEIAIASLKTDEAYQLEYEKRDCVEVVRCKDCKFCCLDEDGSGRLYCERWDYTRLLVGDVSYCAWGEKRNEDQGSNTDIT